MKNYKSLFLLLITIGLFIACNDDDDGGSASYRDEGEVYAEDITEIEEFLETHFVELVDNPSNPNYQQITFDTIAEENSDKQPIMESDMLEHKTISSTSVDYKLYYLKIREGAPEQYQPTFADNVVVTYQGMLMDRTVFDEAVNPTFFEFYTSDGGLGVIRGFAEGIIEFKGASGYVENEDGTISYNDDFGIGAVFIPSGLGYFADPPSGSVIGQYEPLIFGFQLYKGQQVDHDNDGIPSHMEDLNGNGILLDDNTDGDQDPNYLDSDDDGDGDGTPTKDEIEVNDANGDGIITEDEIEFTDTNNDGIYDYLDPDIF